MSKLLSVIICVYNMRREAPRTILSALPPYQKKIKGLDYEVIVVDNGSSEPIAEEFLGQLPDGLVRYVHYPGKSPSPVFALNWAAREVAKGKLLMFCIDGARIFSQGLVSESVRWASLRENTFVYSLGWHLGYKPQGMASKEGYNQAAEDALLAEIDWQHHPERLFENSVFANSSRKGFFSAIAESNAFTLSRQMFRETGGYDERFASPGGGLANLELFARYVQVQQYLKICLLGEGTFHQYHGGASTTAERKWEEFLDEYSAIMGMPYKVPRYQALFAGPLKREVQPFYVASSETVNFKII